MPAIAAEEAERNRKSGTETGASHNAAAPERNMSPAPMACFASRKRSPYRPRTKAQDIKHPSDGCKKHCAPILPLQGKRSNNQKHTPSSNLPRQAEAKEASKKRKDSKRKPPKRQERNSINQVEKKISLQKKISLFLFHCKPFFPTHPLPYVLPRTAPIPCVLSSFYVQYRKYKPIIQAAGSSMKLEKSGQRAKMDISIKSI